MVVNKDPVSPDTMKQQTLDSLVKKSKHGRSTAKKLYSSVNEEQNDNIRSEKNNETSEKRTTAIVRTKIEIKIEPKKLVAEKRSVVEEKVVKKDENKAPSPRPTRTTRVKKENKQVKTLPKSEDRCQKLTDFFPVRRSKRQPLSKLKDLEYEQLKEKILSKSTEGLEIRVMEDKGRGVFSTRHFERKEFIVEYSGTLISFEEAKRREVEYGKEPEKYGCYMYYFVFKNKKYCVDGTAEDGSYGRLLNHSKSGNVESKLVNVNSKPVLILIAKEDIDPGTELCYDYGERSKDIIQSHPWLNQ